jgi:hypothetical protein
LDLSFFLHKRGLEYFQKRAYSFDSNMKDKVSEGFKVNAFRASMAVREMMSPSQECLPAFPYDSGKNAVSCSESSRS